MKRKIFLLLVSAAMAVIPTMAGKPYGTPIRNRTPTSSWPGRPKEPMENNLFGLLEDYAVMLYFENPEGEASVTVTTIPQGETLHMDWDTTHNLCIDLTDKPESIDVTVTTSEGNTYSGTVYNSYPD